jgi:hypothetical protein
LGTLFTVKQRQEPLEFVSGGGMFNPSLPPPNPREPLGFTMGHLLRLRP